eukprot:290321-Pyramimonas_sp.AAC.1
MQKHVQYVIEDGDGDLPPPSSAAAFSLAQLRGGKARGVSDPSETRMPQQGGKDAAPTDPRGAANSISGSSRSGNRLKLLESEPEVR